MLSLADYFAPEKVGGYTYTDGDCVELSALLEDEGFSEWAKRPRLYILCRLLDQVSAMEDFVRLGFNDICLPFPTPSSLPRALRSCAETFLERQSSVLTEAVVLEKGFGKGKYVDLHIEDRDLPYQSTGKLGTGRNAVDRVRSTLSGNLFARKRFQKRLGPNSRSILKEFENELNIMKRIDHEHCVRFVGSYTDRRYFGVLMVPVAEHSLTDFLASSEQHVRHRITLGTFFGCLASALHYLHQNQIRHRDIKPDNILVKGAGVYLTDFGISLDWQQLSRSTTDEASGLTYNYCAPEVLDPDQKRNSRTDIWSLGCVFMEILVVKRGLRIEDLKTTFRSSSGTTAFHKNTETAYTWIRSRLQEPRPKKIGPTISELIEGMLSLTPGDRPDAAEIYHIISTFQSRDVDSSNPYCGQCCISEDVTDDGFVIDLPGSPPYPSSLDENSRVDSLNDIYRQLKEDASYPHGRAESDSRKSSLSSRTDMTEKRVERGSFTPRRDVLLETPPESISGTTTGVSAKPSHFQAPLYGKLLEGIKFNRWPPTNLEGELPHINDRHWNDPTQLQIAIWSSTVFMEYIGRVHPDLAKRVLSSQLADLLSLIHLFLYNGLSIPEIRRSIPETRRIMPIGLRSNKPTSYTPIMAVMRSAGRGVTPTWQETRLGLPMIALLAAFAGVEGERGSPLGKSLKNSNFEITKVLLDAGANPNEIYPQSGGQSILMFAAGLSDNSTVAMKFLLEAGAQPHDPLALGAQGQTLFHVAARKGSVDAITFLLGLPWHDKLINAKDITGKTALDYADINLSRKLPWSKSRHAAIVSCLISAGAERGVSSK